MKVYTKIVRFVTLTKLERFIQRNS